MQAVMCGIFTVSVSLAVVVTHHLRSTGGIRLAGGRHVDNIAVKLPAGWLLEHEGDGSRDPVLFIAHEPDTEQLKGRRITVRRYKVQPGISSQAFLNESGLLQGTERRIKADPAENMPVAITLAGEPGVLETAVRPTGDDPADGQTELFAASVRPSGLAIILQLECPDDTDPDGDELMLRKIASEIEVRD